MKACLPVGIALGSNQGDRIEHLKAAISHLQSISLEPIKCSRVYETAPVDCLQSSPSFLNAVCEIKCDWDFLHLLHWMRDFEKVRGRSEVYSKNSPRPLDMDLLYAGDLVVQIDELVIPHPRILERRFVLQPLCDIRPDLKLPNQSRNILQILHGLRDDHAVRLYSPQILKRPIS